MSNVERRSSIKIKDSSSSESDEDSDSSGYTDWEDSFPYESNIFELSRVYRFTQRISTNDETVVYEAYSKKKKKVVVKILDEKVSDKKHKLVRIMEICKKFPHLPNIHAWHNLRNTDCLAISSEYVEGSLELAEYCGGDVKKIKNIIYQTALAVNFLHSNNIIHRDIKPSNILFDGRRVILIDFDLSTFYKPERGHTANVGTTGWKAPEVDKCIKYDKSIDIFSLGMVMGFLLLEVQEYDITSSTPIISRTVMQKIADTRKKTLVYDLLGKMISEDPVKRPSIKKVLEHDFFTTTVKKKS